MNNITEAKIEINISAENHGTCVPLFTPNRNKNNARKIIIEPDRSNSFDTGSGCFTGINLMHNSSAIIPTGILMKKIEFHPYDSIR
jgi:hypothetical protein